ncbi:MAG: peptidoglycan DD-metalloendopeptidase family protein [Acidobacteria bacterium]|nr:peptidoglycan DD-metalloendopeptidase family protein [Acidobacteriota bacterium]
MEVKPAGPGKVGTADAAQVEAQRAQLARLAHEFEAMFLSEMLRGMRHSMLTDEEQQGLGNATMTDTFDSELGLSLSRSGGFGLANLMLEALARQGMGGPAGGLTPTTALTAYASTPAATDMPGKSSGSAPAAVPQLPHPDELLQPAPPAAPAQLVATPPASPISSAAAAPVSLAATQPGPVTSPFGWRADPFTGQAKFHAGTDVRMAYGQEVQAVASGRVQSVKDRQGYGLTVVIDHGNGLETRYAHLSGATVREGDTVEAGQVVARSGNSGRSTGPHLHLEARMHGKAVDMAAVLKSSGTSADSFADGSNQERP